MFSKGAVERFWVRVNRGGGDECWEWARFRNRQGYGRLSIDGRLYLAHRAAWIISGNALADTDCVLHRCDNPPCCNPAHLFVGDRKANNVDSAAKGRGFFNIINKRHKGTGNPAAKLSDEDVIAIRASPDTQQSIADRYGIHQGTVSRIKLGKNWKHV